MCPYYLDGDLGKSLAALPGDTRVIGYCAVFKVREEASATWRPGDLVQRAAGVAPVSQNSTACEPPRRGWAQPCDLPDPVDMSSGRSRSGGRASRSSRAAGPGEELKATIRR
jgi:hypothetical protein